MTIGHAAASGMGAAPEQGTTPPLATELREALDQLLRRQLAAPLSAPELRAALQGPVRRARADRVPVEQLLVGIKTRWTALLEDGAAGPRVERARQLERLVTLAIETYYES